MSDALSPKQPGQRAVRTALLLACAALLAIAIPHEPVSATQTCAGQIATHVGSYVVGTSGDDVILGTSGPDQLYGGGGDDIICGGSGDDELYGHNGDDLLYGGDGDDKLVGQNDDDELYGNNGDDKLYGSAGADKLVGQNGNDELYGNDGNDKLYGSAGADKLVGHNGNDELYGNDGNDKLYGSAGADKLVGHNGNDELYGNDGNDKLYGSAGGDKLVGHNGNDELYGNDGNDELSGSAGDDLLKGNDGDDILNGGPGNDVLNGGPGNDTIDGVPESPPATPTPTPTPTPGPPVPPQWGPSSQIHGGTATPYWFTFEWCCAEGQVDSYQLTITRDDGATEVRTYLGVNDPLFLTGENGIKLEINSFQGFALTPGASYNLSLVAQNSAGATPPLTATPPSIDDSGNIQAQYPGGSFEAAPSPSPPSLAIGSASASGGCVPQGVTDNLHVSTTTTPNAVSVHAWWQVASGVCGPKADVVVGLQGWYCDTVTLPGLIPIPYFVCGWQWVGLEGLATNVFQGGGTANRATAKAPCQDFRLVGYRAIVDVDVLDTPDPADLTITPGTNLACYPYDVWNP